MRKNGKIIKAFLLATLMATTIASCTSNKKPREEGTLAILAYNGGYGTEWLEDICLKFEEETGISVTYATDATILDKMDSQLVDVSDYDIYMSHGIAWQNYAERGLLANLDDLYESDVGGGKKFKDRFANNPRDYSAYKNDKGEEHYYKVAFTQGAGGIVYNIDMFEKNGWTVPETYDELVTLCDQIVAKNIVPFAWAGSGQNRDYYWDYPIYEWWAEMDGIDNINNWLTFKGADGTYKNGYDNFDPNGKFANFKKAYQMWYDLIAAKPQNSNERAYGTTLSTAQAMFFNQEAAMIPYGQWAKHEIEKAMGKEFTFNIAMMHTPKVKKESKNYNFMVGFGDSMIVPENSPNKESAKEFLKFMSGEYACKAFVEKADGPFLAFDYSTIDMTDLNNSSTYIKSVYDILTESVNFSTASNSPILVLNGDTKVQPWFNNERYYSKALQNPSANTPEEVISKLYDSAKNSWPSLCRTAGVQ